MLSSTRYFQQSICSGWTNFGKGIQIVNSKAWFQETGHVEWRNPKDIKREYPSASILADNRVVFNIKGNHYRLVVRINYDYQMVWIRFIGTHAEYDKIDATKI